MHALSEKGSAVEGTRVGDATTEGGDLFTITGSYFGPKTTAGVAAPLVWYGPRGDLRRISGHSQC